MKPCHELLKLIQNQQAPSLFALIGTDSWLLQSNLKQGLDLAVPAAQDFNTTIFQAKKSAITDVIQAAQTLPMMARFRWIQLENIHLLPKADQEVLMKYAASPSPSTYLCLSGEKLDLRSQLGKWLKKQNAIFSANPPTRREVTGWILLHAKANNVQIRGPAAQILGECIGTNVGTLHQTLDQLQTYVGVGHEITETDVADALRLTKIHNVFELTDALGKKDLPRASQLVIQLLDAGDNALMLVVMMARQIRLLLSTHTLLENSCPQRELPRELGVQPFVVKSLLQQVKFYSQTQLLKALTVLGDMDYTLKSTRLSPSLVMEQGLLKLIGEES
ncbi:MAG: DNA polymerase III subunit delta [Myxococcota bacterium]|nr:DNA polymerase III subunit delta [Myxococcota bacterium]